jgi:hypothetical protein
MESVNELVNKDLQLGDITICSANTCENAEALLPRAAPQQ